MADALPNIQHVIAVGSGKGGVGKSTVAVNIALSLRQQGLRVGLLDADIYGPSLPIMLGVRDQEPRLNADGKIIPIEAHELKTMSIGFVAKDSQAIIWRGPMIHKMLTEFISRVDWGSLDYLIVDLPPGTGDVQLSLSQLIPMTGAVVVTTPQEVALADVRRAVEMFKKVRVPILGVIENMSYYTCGKCQDRSDIFSSGGGETAAREWQTRFLGGIPLVQSVREGGDVGIPIVASDPRSSVAQSFQRCVQQLMTVVDEQGHARSSDAWAIVKE